MKKIKIFFCMILLSFQVFFLKIRNRFHGHHYKIAPKGQAMLNYCIKVIWNKDYTYSSYEEMQLSNELNQMAERRKLSRQETALIIIKILLATI